jgi:hypothetical protein
MVNYGTVLSGSVGKPAGIALDADGRFTGLMTFRSGVGVLVGKHRVVVAPETKFETRAATRTRKSSSRSRKGRTRSASS